MKSTSMASDSCLPWRQCDDSMAEKPFKISKLSAMLGAAAIGLSAIRRESRFPALSSRPPQPVDWPMGLYATRVLSVRQLNGL